MTISAGQAITKADLDTALQTVDGLSAVSLARRPPIQRQIAYESPASSSPEDLSLLFTPMTDEEFRGLFWQMGGTGTITATLTVVGSELSESTVGIFLLDEPITKTSTGPFPGEVRVSLNDEDRIYLLKGVTYKLTFTVDSGTPTYLRGYLCTRATVRRA